MILAGLLATAVATAAEAGPRTLSASLVYDLIAQQTVPSYASIETQGPRRVTCLSAKAPATATGYATCYIFAPGFHGNVPAGNSIVTTGPGAVRLGCDGYPYPVSCSARVEE
jgi:hypothetical protein